MSTLTVAKSPVLPIIISISSSVYHHGHHGHHHGHGGHQGHQYVQVNLTMSCFRVEMGEGVLRREGGGVVMQGMQGRRTGLRIVLGALCVGAVVGLSLAIALPATQAAEQVSDQC